MKKSLIKNGEIINAHKRFKADILVSGEKIERIEYKMEADADTVIDASGKLIFPGFIDAHTHMGIPIRGTESADDFDSGTMAALHGGVTTVMDFTVQEKGESLLSSLERRMKRAAGKAHVDYTFHCSVTDLDEKRLQEIPEIVKQGVISFKAFTAYKKAGMQLNDRQILDLLRSVKSAGGTVMFHAENGDIVDFLTDTFLAYNKTSAKHHALSRPAEAEIEAVTRILTLNRFVECPIYFVHLTTTEAAQLTFMAKENGQPVFLETCPQYLLFEDSVYEQENGHRFIASPPFRKQNDLAYLWMALNQGVMDVVGTDHCPFTIAQKDTAGGAFHLTPNGLDGVETLFPLLYSEGVKKGRLPLRKMVSLISEEPARLFGLFPQKGIIMKASDADLIIFNPEGEGTINSENLHSAAGWSVYEGKKTSGVIESVMQRGNWLLKDGELQEENLHKGQFVKALI